MSFIHDFLFRAEYQALVEARAQAAHAKRQLEDMKRPPARITIEPTMTERAIEDALAGTADTDPIKAIVAKMSAAIVVLSDRATDMPRETIETRDGIVAGFSEAERIHVAGQVSGLAEMLREIQQLTKSRPQ